MRVPLSRCLAQESAPPRKTTRAHPVAVILPPQVWCPDQRYSGQAATESGVGMTVGDLGNLRGRGDPVAAGARVRARMASRRHGARAGSWLCPAVKGLLVLTHELFVQLLVFRQ